MRAPPESFNPITGAPLRMAKSMTFTIFCALVSEREPPKTVKSCAKTYTNRPSMRPNPVTKPSPPAAAPASQNPRSDAAQTYRVPRMCPRPEAIQSARARKVSRPCARVHGVPPRRRPPLPPKYGAIAASDPHSWMIPRYDSFQPRGPPSGLSLFGAKIRTDAWVASHTVPSNSTTPSNISARIAPARGSGDSIDVTYSVARTRITMALSVVATTISIVRMERITCFMGGEQAGDSSQPKHSAFTGKAEFREAAPLTKPGRHFMAGEGQETQHSQKRKFLTQA